MNVLLAGATGLVGREALDLFLEHPSTERVIALTRRPLGRLRSAIWQYPFRNFEEVIRKMNRYSSLGIGKLVEKRVSMGGALAKSWCGVSIRPSKLRTGTRRGATVKISGASLT